MNEALLVSAIITTHNRCELLLKAIQSVLCQSYKNIECIVVDDASTDDTEREMMALEREKKIKYIRIEHSKGGNHARNEGIRAAKGNLIAFLDDDDEWFPDKTEKQIHCYNENVKFVYCGMIRETNYDNDTKIGTPIQDNKRYPVGDLSREILIHILTNTSTILVDRNLLTDVGLFDEKINYWQEYDLCIRLLQSTQAGKVPENLVLYRVLKKDSKRLSNNIKGWEESVNAISKKYSSMFDELSFSDRALRKLYIYMDGIARATTINSTRDKIKYYGLIIVHPIVFYHAIKKALSRIGIKSE